jgi:hypothetical protein
LSVPIINQSIALQPIVQLAYDSLDLFPVIPSPSPKDELLSGIDTLRTVINNRPNSAAMKTSLQQANTTIANMPDITGISNSITSLNTQVNTFPDIDPLITQVSAAQTQLGSQTQLNSLLSSNQLMTTQHSIDSLGNLGTEQQQVQSLGTSIDDVDIDSVITNLASSDTLTDTQKANALAK